MSSFYAKEALLSGFQVDPEPKWKDLPPINQKRYLHAAVKLDKHRILVTGGQDENWYVLKSTEVYDTRTNQWQNWPGLNEKRSYHAAAHCNGKVYVFGGYNGNTRLDSIECLDLSSEPLQWKTLNVTLSCTRSGCTAAVVGTDIYIMGGFDGSSRLSSVDILDTTTGTIRQGPSMTTARSRCGAGVVDNAIYVVGGWDANGNRLNTIEYLSVKTTTKDLGKWHECNATMSTAREYPAVAVVHHCLVIMGGRGKNLKDLSSVDVFDTRRNVCWRLPDMNQWRWGCAAVTLNESQVVVVGGCDGDTRHASMETITLDPATLQYFESRIPQLETKLQKARGSLNLVGKKKRITSLESSLQNLCIAQRHLLNEKRQLEAVHKRKKAEEEGKRREQERTNQERRQREQAERERQAQLRWEKEEQEKQERIRRENEEREKQERLRWEIKEREKQERMRREKVKQEKQERIHREEQEKLAQEQRRQDEMKRAEQDRLHRRQDSTNMPEVVTVGEIPSDDPPKAVIHVYNKDTVQHLVALLQDIDNTNVSVAMVKDIVELLGDDCDQFETLLIELKQVGFATKVQGYEAELLTLLADQRASDKDAQERLAIKESEADYEFYVHLQWKLRSMILASECLACGMVKRDESLREQLVSFVTEEGFISALNRISFVRTVSAAVRLAMRQFESIPGMHAARKVVELITEVSHERSQQMAVARVAVFSTLVQIREGPTNGLGLFVEQVARLLVRCRAHCIMSSVAKGGPWERVKSFLLHVLGDIASSPAGQQASRAADELYRVIMSPPTDSDFASACEGGLNGVSLHTAFVATFLQLPVHEIKTLARFSVDEYDGEATKVSHEARARQSTRTASSTASSESGTSLTREELAELLGTLKIKQDEHDRVIQKLESSLPNSTNSTNEATAIDVDVGGGLKQQMIFKKSDDGEEETLQTEKLYEVSDRVGRLESMIEEIYERLNGTELSHEEFLAALAQMENKRHKRKKRKARKKRDSH